jgi:uncharacterized protein
MLDLTERELAVVRDLLARRIPGREVRVFGSRANGKAKPYSDLDLLVMGDLPIPASAVAELRADLEDSDLPFRVDVVEWRDLPEYWRPEIAARSRPIVKYL